MRALGARTKAIPERIVEDEQHRDRPQDACALRVAAARAHLARRPSSLNGAPRLGMHCDIACGPAPRICARGARNAAHCTFATDSYGRAELRRAAQSVAWIMLLGSARPVQAMSNAVPWSTEVRMIGSPSVTFTPLSKASILNGMCP